MLSVLLVALLVAIPLVWKAGLKSGTEALVEAEKQTTSAAGAEHRVPDPADTSDAEDPVDPEDADGPEDAAVAEPEPVELMFDASQPQASLYRLGADEHWGTPSERYAFPALSLAKLYIAQYVLQYGTEIEAQAAVGMTSSSDNYAAAQLYATYPESIDVIAEEYQLHSTVGAEQWGYSSTSTFDVVHFVATLLAEDPEHPILTAMAGADDYAADGYAQDFGTAVLPGAVGSKWGWSDDLTVHSSVTFGEDWVAAAAMPGSAADLSAYTRSELLAAFEEGEQADN